MTPEEKKEYNKKYYQEHKKEHDARHAEYNDEHREEINERRRECRLENKERYLEYNRKAYHAHKHDEEFMSKRRMANKERNRRMRKRVIEIIAEKHNMDVKCWRCGETLYEVLTIGHIYQNGKEDREKNGTGPQFYKKIIDGDYDCDQLMIECYNCNYCLEHTGKYPDEIRHEGEKDV